MVSVIIPTYNRAERLAETLASVVGSSLDSNRYEIIVVDDGSTDETPQVAEMQYPCRFRYFRQANQGDAHARNQGSLHSEESLLVFIDDDITLAPDALSALVRSIRESEHRIVVGTLIPADQVSSGLEPVVAVEADEPAVIPFTDCQCGIFAIRRTEYMDLGMMDPLPAAGSSLWCDVELAYRAYLRGYTFWRSRIAWGAHHDYAGEDFESYCHRIRRAAAVAVLLFHRHPDLRRYLPMFHDKSPIAWGQDPPRLVIRKALRTAFSTEIAIRLMVLTAAALGQIGSTGRLSQAIERWVVGGHIFRGYRGALNEFGVPPMPTVEPQA